MGFFSDFLGSSTGKNERSAAKDAAAGFQRGIEFTKEQIEQSRADTQDLMRAAFQNVQTGLEAALPVRQQAIQSQLQLLGAGTERLSPQGPVNALRRGVQAGNAALMGGNGIGIRGPETKSSFTPVTDQPFNVQAPKYVRS